MYRFHVSIHPLPPEAAAGPTIDWDGVRWTTLRVAPERLGSLCFHRSFEELAGDLGRLPRLFVEPDGSFVWVSSQSDTLWQLDGMIYDHQDRVRLLDVQGNCPAEQCDQLLRTLGWPGRELMFQPVRAAMLLDEAEFRRYAQRAEFAGPAGGGART